MGANHAHSNNNSHHDSHVNLAKHFTHKFSFLAHSIPIRQVCHPQFDLGIIQVQIDSGNLIMAEELLGV